MGETRRAFGPVLWVVSLCCSAVAAAEMSGDEIVKKAEMYRFPDDPVEFVVEVQDLKGKDVVKESQYSVVTDARDRSIVETLKPDRNRGRKLLMVDNDLWFFSPDIRRPVRVSLSQKLTGEISNGDLAATQFANDYSARLVGREVVQGRDCFKLALKSKRKGTTYAALTYWVSAKDFTPVRTDYLAKSGRVMKSGTYLKFSSFQNHPRVSELKIVDAVKKSNASVLRYSGHKPVKVSPATFSKESMAR